jgi:glycogen operon protein
MTEADWEDGGARAMGVFLNGSAIPGRDTRGERVAGDSFLVLLNAGNESVGFSLPKGSWGESWTKVLDTCDAGIDDTDVHLFAGGEELELGAYATVVLRRAD